MPFLRLTRLLLTALATLAACAAPAVSAEPPDDQDRPAVDFNVPRIPALGPVPDPTRPGTSDLTPPPGRELDPLRFSRQTDGLWGTLSGKQVIQDRPPSAAWEDPTFKRSWESEESWRCKVAGPVALFGQMGATGGDVAQQDVKVSGRTGVACQVPVPLGAELVLRGGPSLTYTDPLRPEHTTARSELSVELQGRLPLLFGVGLEYQGTATPGLNPQERDRLQQDLRLAFPVGSSGKLKLGAKHKWENTVDPKPVPDAMQLYLGLELTR
jgi:hypothetical protein